MVDNLQDPEHTEHIGYREHQLDINDAEVHHSAGGDGVTYHHGHQRNYGQRVDEVEEVEKELAFGWPHDETKDELQ